MNYLFQTFFQGTGGVTRWFVFQLINVTLSKNYPRNLEYYTDYQNQTKDKNGYTTMQKNFVTGILVLIVAIVIIEKIE